MQYTIASMALVGLVAAQQYGPSSTASCPAPGETATDGRYSCNPAHTYPEGQICQEVDGCYYLRAPGPGVSVSASASATPSSTACPAPGTTAADGRYSCNPAHTYPEGQICQLDNGCYYLRVEAPGVSATSSAPAYTTIVCPSPTTIITNGQTYSIPHPTTLTVPVSQKATAPASYPAAPASSAPSGPASAAPSAPVSCPAPGSTDAQGRYSCNPAHQYPAGQTCVSQNGGCPYLVAASSTAPALKPTSYPGPAGGNANATRPSVTPYTGAAHQTVAIAAAPLAALVFGAIFLL